MGKILLPGRSNLKPRVTSGIFIGFVFITVIFLFRPLFFALMLGIGGVMLAEWYDMTSANKKYLSFGLVIIPTSIISVLQISNIDQAGWLLFTFFSIIWCVDSVAMFTGRVLQGPKLAPVLSPKKTISGLCGGVFAASLLPLLLNLLPFYDISAYVTHSKPLLMLQVAFIGIMAQVSDLFISYFKRKFKIKDSGTIIPGHGGMLDRFDSIILTAPIVAIYLRAYIG